MFSFPALISTTEPVNGQNDDEYVVPFTTSEITELTGIPALEETVPDKSSISTVDAGAGVFASVMGT